MSDVRLGKITKTSGGSSMPDEIARFARVHGSVPLRRHVGRVANGGEAETGEEMDDRPTLGKIARENGAAGQVSYSVTVTYPGEAPTVATFVGSAYGGPVVAVMPSGAQTYVSDPGRFGTFGPEWVRRFFS